MTDVTVFDKGYTLDQLRRIVKIMSEEDIQYFDLITNSGGSFVCEAGSSPLWCSFVSPKVTFILSRDGSLSETRTVKIINGR